MNISINLIEVGTRLRGATPETVAALASSIAEVGLLHPIAVYERQVMQGGVYVSGYGIVAGLHRFEACRSLGLVEIPANVVTLGELQRQIAECDENLCGPKLTQSERAIFTLRRKQAYEALYPETKHGGDRSSSRQLGDLSRFTADTSAKTGQSERVIQRDAARGEKINTEVLDQVRGTNIDTGATLDALAECDLENQPAMLVELQRRKADNDLLRKTGDAIVVSDSDLAAATIIIDYISEEIRAELLPHFSAAGYSRLVKAVGRVLLERNGRRDRDTPVFDRTSMGRSA